MLHRFATLTAVENVKNMTRYLSCFKLKRVGKVGKKQSLQGSIEGTQTESG